MKVEYKGELVVTPKIGDKKRWELVEPMECLIDDGMGFRETISIPVSFRLDIVSTVFKTLFITLEFSIIDASPIT